MTSVSNTKRLASRSVYADGLSLRRSRQMLRRIPAASSQCSDTDGVQRGSGVRAMSLNLSTRTREEEKGEREGVGEGEGEKKRSKNT